MPARKPEDCDYLVAEAINNGDLEAAVALYEPDATFAVEPGKEVHGHAAIREVMRGFIAAKPKLTMKVPRVYQSGDVAILISAFSSTSTGADGKQESSSGNGTEVVRRQPDGTWLFLIDNPNGLA